MAHKKIPFYDAESDATEKPSSNNGVKLEKFVFDVFEFARDGKFVVWECLRDMHDMPHPLLSVDSAKSFYRVTKLVGDMGLVDFDFVCSSVCPILLG